MGLFLLGMAILIVGYFTYGRFVEKVLAPDDRPTPAVANPDGVDYMVLPHWKNMLIQLLNIAGIGPVIGVIIGIRFGVIAFLIIPIGNILAGAVHDFLSGMMSIRNNGANLPKLIRLTLGEGYYRFFSIFMCVVLLLVVAVFINVPAQLIEGMNPDDTIFWYAVAGIFVYYILATLFPVDTIIGRLYPIFGGLLILSSVAIFAALLVEGFRNPVLLTETEVFRKGMIQQPIFPVLFVTIACGIISGFHATQSPIIARTMKSERLGRQSFYGMMVLEGIIAMIWAAAALMIFNLAPEWMGKAPALALGEITRHFLGGWMGMLTVLGVVVLAITSGDTAMRSLRLSLSEMLKIDQKPLLRRVGICVPLIIIVMGLLMWSNHSPKTFGQLWNYFAWSNQVLAFSTLLAATAWLRCYRKNPYIAFFPALFMGFIIFCYILWVSPSKGGPVGCGLDLKLAYILAAVLSLGSAIWAFRRGGRIPCAPAEK